jgi:hypothetical protein
MKYSRKNDAISPKCPNIQAFRWHFSICTFWFLAESLFAGYLISKSSDFQLKISDF